MDLRKFLLFLHRFNELLTTFLAICKLNTIDNNILVNFNIVNIDFFYINLRQNNFNSDLTTN